MRKAADQTPTQLSPCGTLVGPACEVSFYHTAVTVTLAVGCPSIHAQMAAINGCRCLKLTYGTRAAHCMRRCGPRARFLCQPPPRHVDATGKVCYTCTTSPTQLQHHRPPNVGPGDASTAG